MTTDIRTNEGFQRLLDALCQQASTILRSQYASIWLRKGHVIQLSAATGYSHDLDFSQMFYEEGEGLTGYIAQGNTYKGTFKDIRGNPRWKGKFDNIQWPDTKKADLNTFLGVPIVLDQVPIGALKVENKEGNEPFSDEDQEMIETMANLIGTAIKSQPDLLDRILGPYIFVLMPFAAEFRDVYDIGIKAVAIELKCRCERVDDLEHNGPILSKIYQEIKSAHLIIADVTGRNPNVFYEVGFAHALHKETILITQRVEDIPFDLRGHNHIIYEGKIGSLRQSLHKRIDSFLHDNPFKKSIKPRPHERH